MTRTMLPSFLPLAALLAGACAPSQAPGDVQYGEYTVEATLREGGCELRPGEGDRDAFEFWARVGADVDGETSYLTVAEPPGNIEQRPRRGVITGDGELVFDVSEYQDLEACGCLLSVGETITLVPVTDPDNGTADGGTGDADGGITDGGEGADGGLPDGGAQLPEVPGLPGPAEVTGLSGTIEYAMKSGGNCPPLETDADGGVVSGCQLPCTFSYDLEGVRED